MIWEQNWAAGQCFTLIDYVSINYVSPIKNTLIVHENGFSKGYLRSDEVEKLGKSVAKSSKKNLAKNLKSAADEIRSFLPQRIPLA